LLRVPRVLIRVRYPVAQSGAVTRLFERPEGGDRAVLVHVDFRSREDQEEVDEFLELVAAAGAETICLVRATREVPDPRLFVGRGKAEEIRDALVAHQGELVLFNHALSPAQERNLERLVQCRVLDRTGLILDIFAQRARSFDGKLQVELAQLRHLSTRLVRGWTHLERQKGGIGLRGPGEKQLETDRRLLGARIQQISQRLDRVRKQRGLRRSSRRKAAFPVVSLVGYTNAGKSTLFNRLTDAGVFVADKLFATLDPILRRVEVGRGRSLILADTVGFIRHLPHDLVAAFRSTLEETQEADLLLHVTDASDPEREEKTEQVNRVLAEIGAQDLPQLQVFNKTDRLDGGQARIERGPEGRVHRVWLSARTGAGVEMLRRALAERLTPVTLHHSLRLPASAGRLRARLFELGAVVSEHLQDGDWVVEVEIPGTVLEQLCRTEGLSPEAVAASWQAS
jgi:GTP-binding protein HflX